MTLPTENDTQQLYNQTTDQKKSKAFGMICNVTETIIIRENSQYYIKHCVCYARKLPLALKNTYPSVSSSVSSIPHLTSEPPPPGSGGCRWLEGCVTVGSGAVRLLPLAAKPVPWAMSFSSTTTGTPYPTHKAW